MADKKAFVFDTNFIIQNKELDEALNKLKEKFTIYVTQVSVDERIAQQCRDMQKDFDEAERCKAKFIHFATIEFKKTYEEACEFYQIGVQAKYEEYFGNRIIPFKKDGEVLSTIIDRANKRIPPFSSAKDASDKGFKDCLLWISLLEYFKNNGEDEVVFVTDDGGFKNNAEFLCEEFNKTTKKTMVIKPNSYYSELLEAEKGEKTAKPPKPLPDFTSLRDRIHNTIYDLCFVVSPDYWGNEAEEPIFLISRTVDELDMGLFFSGLEKIIDNHILEKSVLTEEVFDAIDGASPVMHTVPISALEQALRLYEEIKEKYPEYVNQFYSAVVSMFNRNYVNPENTINPDDELPF